MIFCFDPMQIFALKHASSLSSQPDLSALSEPLGGVRNLQVTDPTTSSLKVRWEPAEGNVRQYRLFYVPASGGAEDMVSLGCWMTIRLFRVEVSDPRDLMCRMAAGSHSNCV